MGAATAKICDSVLSCVTGSVSRSDDRNRRRRWLRTHPHFNGLAVPSPVHARPYQVIVAFDEEWRDTFQPFRAREGEVNLAGVLADGRRRLRIVCHNAQANAIFGQHW